MTLAWTDQLDAVDWNDLSALYRVALGEKSAATLKTVFGNSLYRWIVSDQGRIVAAGRALSDGIDCSYICDVAVLPDYQGSGLGKQIVGRLVEQSRGHKKILLYAVPGKEAFYRKFGFERMATAMAIFEDQALARERGYIDES
jgi:N-acetylglutamate synthase-like GNAT family acetyltransferase